MRIVVEQYLRLRRLSARGGSIVTSVLVPMSFAADEIFGNIFHENSLIVFFSAIIPAARFFNSGNARCCVVPIWRIDPSASLSVESRAGYMKGERCRHAGA